MWTKRHHNNCISLETHAHRLARARLPQSHPALFSAHLCRLIAARHLIQIPSPPSLQRLSLPLRLDLTRVRKYAGTLLIFWPFAWAMSMVARRLEISVAAYAMSILYGLIASFLLRREQRTKTRPLASGRMSVQAAFALLAANLAILLVALWPMNKPTWDYGLIATFIYPGIYPLMKRVTYWPQAWLGLAMNVGIPMAWTAYSQTVSASAFILAAGTWSWTMWYDTIYACQDKKDDAQVGVMSTALLFGGNIRPVLAVLAGSFAASLALAGVANEQGVLYYAISVAGGIAYLLHLTTSVDVDDPKSCGKVFYNSGVWLGALIYAGTLADYLAAALCPHTVSVTW
ncbi:UbiA-domain-containing protein [Schizophyllum commune H4-8]|uniref:UbiA-domain-containing protein n=1 Tax=Schizophyllum commune (strain H4-8 / FGSC 9210) TaxID=578458 RepID=UPI00215F8E6F|nr:UbiA-domain-containing protein [Schizophyllum commune H4-8]KAI5892145.1 UbiA-domain-containing protein [Schizophyllum commune H4-8]